MTKVLETTIFELKQNRTSENLANFEAEGEVGCLEFSMKPKFSS